MSAELTQEKARIFRVTHKNNLGWILRHGLHCARSRKLDPNFVSIGNADLISKRPTRLIPPDDATGLADYVPFYFTPFSPMMYNIHTGWGGIQKRPNNDIIIVVSSLHLLQEKDVDFLFTDRHAYLQTAQFFSKISDLDYVDWKILQKRDFKHDSDDPGKMDRYMAEALVRRHVPIAALLGVACYDSPTKTAIDQQLRQCGVELKTVAKPGWYF